MMHTYVIACMSLQEKGTHRAVALCACHQDYMAKFMSTLTLLVPDPIQGGAQGPFFVK